MAVLDGQLGDDQRVASVANPLATGNLAVSTIFRAVVTNGICGEAYSTAAAVTVDALPVGGTAVAAASTVCFNSGALLALTNLIGGIQKWQSSVDSWATTNDIPSTDNPLTTSNLTVTTVFRAVVTNGACGPVYSSEVVVTLDVTPPVLVAPTNFTVVGLSPWSFGTPRAVDNGLEGVVVYDNSVNDLGSRFETGTNEVGNEIILAGTERYLEGFSYEFWSTNLTGSPWFEGTNVTVRLRFYANDGTNFNGYATPQMLLYDSGEFWLGMETKPRATVVYDEFDLWLYALYPLMDLLPPNFTWTVQFSGLGEHDRVGVDLYSPPVIGRSYGDFWLRTDEGWQLREIAGLPTDIAARAIASTNRVTITVLSTVTNASFGDGFVATRTWVATDACGNSSTCAQSVTVIAVPDTVPPTVLAVMNVGSTNVQLTFSEAVEAASATNAANYVFTNGLAISGALLSSSNTVTLSTSPLVYGSNYVVVINSVRDTAFAPNTIATNTQASFIALPYVTIDIGNPSVASTQTVAASNGVDIVSAGSGIGGTADQFSLHYQLRSGDFDVSVRVAGLGLSDLWAKAGLMARETLAPDSRFAATATTPGMNGTFFEWRDPTNSLASTSGSFPANSPDLWLRLARVGDIFSGFASYDGQTWMQLGAVAISMPGEIYLGLAVSSHSSNQVVIAQFRDSAEVVGAMAGTVVPPHEPVGPSSRKTPVVFSEIMYKPAPRPDTNNLEFIELYNSNPWFHDIGGYRIVADNMSYTLPAGTTLPGGAFLVVAASPGSIHTVYGITNVLGPYTGTLKKSGTLQLFDERGALLLTVPYSNVSPWPVAALGTGHSIVLANPTYGEGDPRAWAISDTVGGSPGRDDTFHPSPLRDVVINELLAHSEDPGVQQFVELYNHSTQTNDLSGCILTDDPATNKFVIPANTLIGPGGFLSFSQGELGFALNGAGATVYFIKPDGSRVLDAVQFEAQADGVSFGPLAGRSQRTLPAGLTDSRNQQQSHPGQRHRHQ